MTRTGKHEPNAVGQRSSSTPQGVHLWLLLWKSTKSLEAQARRSVAATKLCLTDFGILEALLHKGPLPVNALGKKILITSGSMTAAVDRMQAQGLVVRQSSPTDRRERVLHLTSKGTKLIVSLFDDHARDMEQAFSCLHQREKAALASLLRKVGNCGGTTSDSSTAALSSRKKGLP